MPAPLIPCPNIAPCAACDSPAVRTETAALWQLAWPILIGQLATMGMGVVDVAMAGHASAQDLAGVSLGVSIWHLVIITLMGVLMAVNPIVSQHVGARTFGEIPRRRAPGLVEGARPGPDRDGGGQCGAALVFDHLAHRAAGARRWRASFVFVISFALPAFCCYRVLYGYSASMDQTKPMMLIALLALAAQHRHQLRAGVRQLGFPAPGRRRLRLGHAVVRLVRPDRHQLVDPPLAGLPQDAAAGRLRAAAVAADPHSAAHRPADRRHLFRRVQRLQPDRAAGGRVRHRRRWPRTRSRSISRRWCSWCR